MAQSAKTRWDKLDGGRQPSLMRKRDCAALTIPALLPPLGATEATRLDTPYQGLGARGVNHLAAKMLLTLLPPNSTLFRPDLDPEATKFFKSEGVLDQIEDKLADVERSTMRAITQSNLRSVGFETMKHLIVCGDVLLNRKAYGRYRIYRVDHYVCVRGSDGRVREGVVKESVDAAALEEDIIAAHNIDPDGDDDIDIYTHIKFKNGRCEWHQEINDIVVDGSEGDVPEKDAPWIFLRWQNVSGENYSRSLVEEYLGDLESLEGAYKAIIELAAAAGKILLLVHPNASTQVKDLRNAKSGDFVVGTLSDLDVLQLDKLPDFQVVKATAEDLTQRLSHAFMLLSGTVRNSERTTAAEVQDLAKELEDALGGIYTLLAEEMQKPIVRAEIADLRRKDGLPDLPEKAIDFKIITGFDALGRTRQMARIERALQLSSEIAGAETPLYLNIGKILRDVWTDSGLRAADYVKTDQQITDEKNAQAINNTVQNAAPGVAAQLTKGMTQGA